MSWTYSGDPEHSARDKVRFLIGDTDSDDQQLSNEEIASALADSSSNVYRAAVRCVQRLIAKYSRKVTKSVGDLSIQYSDVVKNYRDLLSTLRAMVTVETATPYAGGISIADKEATEDDSDRVAPAFTVGMHDYETVDETTSSD